MVHRFSVRLSAVWAPGSAADLALDDITLGAACFESGSVSAAPLPETVICVSWRTTVQPRSDLIGWMSDI